jgi:hypothetical protein
VGYGLNVLLLQNLSIANVKVLTGAPLRGYNGYSLANGT